MGGGCSKKKDKDKDKDDEIISSNPGELNLASDGNNPTDVKTLQERIESQRGLKVVLVGDANTGKTCIVNRLVHDDFGLTKESVRFVFYYYYF